MVVIEEIYAADHPPVSNRANGLIPDLFAQGCRDFPRTADREGTFLEA